jgi:NADH-quinone oxidoreductase subunit N
MNKHSRYSIEAGLKYFILGSFSSILLLFGFSFVYGFSGFIYLSDLTSYIRYLYSIEDDFFLYSLLICLIFVNVGFLFKIYASPFHFWISDIYQGAPTSVTMFLSTVPVFSYIYMFIKLYVLIFSDVFSFYNYILYILSIMSMLSGVFGALIQRKIKKLIAYSSVSTVGYILSSLSGDNVLMVQQCIFYLIVYLLNIVPIFIIILNYRVNNSGVIDNIRSFSSIYSSNKALFLVLFSFFLSLAGVPPFSGFASKLSLFTALGSDGLFILLFIGLFAAIISCYYYLRVVKMIFYDYSSVTFLFSTFSYSAGFASSCFFFFNIFFLFFYSVLEDISFYISICLYLSI